MKRSSVRRVATFGGFAIFVLGSLWGLGFGLGVWLGLSGEKSALSGFASSSLLAWWCNRQAFGVEFWMSSWEFKAVVRLIEFVNKKPYKRLRSGKRTLGLFDLGAVFVSVTMNEHEPLFSQVKIYRPFAPIEERWKLERNTFLTYSPYT